MTYNFRKKSTFETGDIKSVYYSSKTISYLGPKNMGIFAKIKDSENVNIFKSNIKSWKPENCPCRLCRLYAVDLGFIELELVLLINYDLL